MKLLLLFIFTGFFLLTHFSIAKVKPDTTNEIRTDAETPVIESNHQKNELIRPEPSYGQLLYENHCLGCHESQLHIRSNTRVKSLSQLTDFVRIRADSLALKWDEEEITAVTLFLNQSYYQFSVSQRK